MGPITITMHVQDIETGIWCPVCLLPSAVKVDLKMLSVLGVDDAPIVATECQECGWSC